MSQLSTDNQPDATHPDVGQQSGSILAENVSPGNAPDDIQTLNSVDTQVEETQSQQLQTEHQPENIERIEGKNQVMEESVMLHHETPKKLIEVPENGIAKHQAQRNNEPNQSRDDNQDLSKVSAHETDDLHFLDDYPETEFVHAFTEAPSQGLPSFGNTTSHIERTQELTETEDIKANKIDSSKVSKEPVHASDSNSNKKRSDPKHHKPKPHGDTNLHAGAQVQQDANYPIAEDADVGSELPEAMIYDTVDTDAENAKESGAAAVATTKQNCESDESSGGNKLTADEKKALAHKVQDGILNDSDSPSNGRESTLTSPRELPTISSPHQLSAEGHAVGESALPRWNVSPFYKSVKSLVWPQ